MKKLIAFIIIVVIVIYSGLWYRNASNAKTLVDSKLKEFVENDSSKVQYESSNVSGYPFSYVVTFHKPSVVSTDISASLEGPLSVGTNLIGTKYWIDRSGEMHMKAPLNLLLGEGIDQIIKGKNRLTVDVDNAYPFQAFFHPFETFPNELFSQEISFNEWWNLVKGAEFNGSGIALVDAKHHSPILSTDQYHISWSHKPASHDNHFISILADIQGLKFNNAWIKELPRSPEDQVLLAIENVFNQLALQSGKEGVNFSFEGDALLPASFFEKFSWENFAKRPELAFNINKLDWNSSLGESTLTSALSLKDGVFHFDMSGFSFLNKEGYEATVQSFVEGIKFAAQNSDNPNQEIAKKLLDCCESELAQLIPRYDLLGKIKYDYNVNFSNSNKDNGQTTLKAKPIDVQMDPYGFTLNVDLALNQIFAPEGQLVYQIRNWESAIKDLSAYYNRIHPILIKVVGEQYASFILPPISEESLGQILTFMQAISDTPEEKSQNFKTTIQMNGFTDIKIGKKSAMDFILSGQKLINDLYQGSKPVE